MKRLTQDDIRRRHEQRKPLDLPQRLTEAERQEQLDMLCPPPREPATCVIEKQSRELVAIVVCNDCGVIIGRYPDWFEHAPDCPQREAGGG